MIYRSPQLADDLILGSVKKRGGATPNDITPTLARHALMQGRSRDEVQSASRSLGLETGNIDLNKQRLIESSRRFDQNLGLAKSDLQYNRRAGNVSSIMSGLGLGVSVLGNIAAKKRLQQQIELRNGIIQDLENEGTQSSRYWSKMTQLIGD